MMLVELRKGNRKTADTEDPSPPDACPLPHTPRILCPPAVFPAKWVRHGPQSSRIYADLRLHLETDFFFSRIIGHGSRLPLKNLRSWGLHTLVDETRKTSHKTPRPRCGNRVELSKNEIVYAQDIRIEGTVVLKLMTCRGRSFTPSWQRHQQSRDFTVTTPFVTGH